MARTLLKDTCDIAREILDGKHDADLANIRHACDARLKRQWMKGMRIRLVGTRNAHIEGAEGVILKVNQKSVTVGLGTAETSQWGTTYSQGEFNVSPGLLQKVEVSS